MSRPATLRIQSVPIGSVAIDPANLRRHPVRNLEAIAASLRRFGQRKPIVVDADGIVRAGNGTLEAARALGWEKIDVVRTTLKGADAVAYAIADNRTAELAEWDEAGLAETLQALQAEDFDLAAVGYTDEEVDALLAGLADGDGGPGADAADRPTLAERFVVPPFSVLDARQGYWQDRKRQWLAIGIRGEEGRGDNALGLSEGASEPGLNHYRKGGDNLLGFSKATDQYRRGDGDYGKG